MDTITRKTMLYKTNVEYGDYVINHIQGCSHGCLYPCYAFLMARRFGIVKKYDEWCKPKIVSNALELLDKEIPKCKKNIKTVHLCFSTDPFMYNQDMVGNMSLNIIKKLNENDIACTVLTKGVLPKELACFSKNNIYGISLITLDKKYTKDIEPGASDCISRIESLKELHNKGYKTWISIEPYPTPNLKEQNLLDILNEISFTNKIIFGRTNYNKQISTFTDNKAFYNEQVSILIQFCNNNNIDYHIKNGTFTD